MPPLFGPFAGAGWDYSQLGQQAGTKAYGLSLPGPPQRAPGAPGSPAERADTSASGAPLRKAYMGSGTASPIPVPVSATPTATGLEPLTARRQALFGPFAQLGGYRSTAALAMMTGEPRF
jgi:hypothetical protein